MKTKLEEKIFEAIYGAYTYYKEMSQLNDCQYDNDILVAEAIGKGIQDMVQYCILNHKEILNEETRKYN